MSVLTEGVKISGGFRVKEAQGNSIEVMDITYRTILSATTDEKSEIHLTAFAEGV
jgi:hypothetical protein